MDTDRVHLAYLATNENLIFLVGAINYCLTHTIHKKRVGAIMDKDSQHGFVVCLSKVLFKLELLE